jgi:TonB family protein
MKKIGEWKMKKVKIASSFCLCVMALIAIGLISLVVTAQEKEREKQEQKVERGIIYGPTAGVTPLSPIFEIGVPGPKDGRMISFQGQGYAGAYVGSIQGGDQTFQFLSAEMAFDNKVVKGAPFSGELAYESIQTLADGNRIVNRSTSLIYRDSQGRTRREQEFVGAFGGGDTPRKSIQIFDPVLEHQYILDPQSRIAREFRTIAKYTNQPVMARKVESGVAVSVPVRDFKDFAGILEGLALKKVTPAYPPLARAAKASGSVQVNVIIDENGYVSTAEAYSGHPLLREAAVDAAKKWVFKPTEVEDKPVPVKGRLQFNFVLADNKEAPPPPPNFTRPVAAPFSTQIKMESRTESLGKQTFEGIEAEGTRTINTIPAAAIGNERPIEIVYERWYSPELQMVILTRSMDPRLGETTQRLVNITRSEPDPSLFQVPSDFTVESTPSILRKGVDEVEVRGEAVKRKQNEQ